MMGDITVTYKGSTILDTSTSGTKTLNTAGKYCSDNITVQFTKPSPAGDSKENELVERTITGTYINSRVTEIRIRAFFDCVLLNEVNFPNCSEIWQSAFENCTNLKSAIFPKCIELGSYAFRYCYSIQYISFPICTYIGSFAFESCSKQLTTVNFPSCEWIMQSAFAYCQVLSSISFPLCSTISVGAFARCSSLTTASFPKCEEIWSSAFYSCVRLKSLYLTNSSVVSLSHSGAFGNTPIGGYSNIAGTFGSIYVPTSLLASYKAATNWAYFSSRFVGV